MLFEVPPRESIVCTYIVPTINRYLWIDRQGALCVTNDPGETNRFTNYLSTVINARATLVESYRRKSVSFLIHIYMYIRTISALKQESCARDMAMENGASITSGNNFICIPNGSKVSRFCLETKAYSPSSLLLVVFGIPYRSKETRNRERERVADTRFTSDQQRANEYNIALNSRTRTINIVEQFTVGAHVKTVLRVASNMAKGKLGGEVTIGPRPNRVEF